MNATSTLAALKADMQKPAIPNVAMSIDTVAGFESMQRIANLFATSSIVPKQYQGNLPNCFIAVDMALRMNANPLMVCQNLYIVHGNPAWSAQFLIATFNKSGRFSSLRYEFQGKEGEDDWGCRAVAIELSTKEKLTGPLITIRLAKKEGWYDKTGSKWQTMPEMMLRYRAAAWFVRAYAPEIAMGLQTAEEVRDMVIDVTPDENLGVVMQDLHSEPAAEPRRDEKIQEPVQEATQVANSQAESHEAATPATDKKTADRQRAAKIRARKQADTAVNDASPGTEPDQNQAPPIADAEEETFECVKEMENGQKKMVTEEDCWYCKDNADCPNKRP